MDLMLDPEQEMLARTARALLARRCPASEVRALERDSLGFRPALWRELAGLGWLGIDWSESAGGAGRTFLERALLLEEMGRVLMPSPMIPSCVLVAGLIAALGTQEQRARWLPAIARGDLVASLALVEPGWRDEWGEVSLEARPEREGMVLSGSKQFVSYAAQADLLLVAVRLEGAPPGPSLVAVARDGRGLRCARMAVLDGEPAYQVEFPGVFASSADLLGTAGGAQGAIEQALGRAMIATLAYALGAAERACELTVEYAKTREQFGRPIGSFQAVAHRCVDMRSDLDALRVLVRQAAWCIATGRPSDLEASAAKVWGNEALRRVFLNAHQVHGAIGFSTECDLQLFTRRAKAAELGFGSANRHRERVARAMGL